MDKLKGTGSTFSTSGKRWWPFQAHPDVARQAQRRHRIIRKGLAPAGDKASLRAAAEQAFATFRKSSQ